MHILSSKSFKAGIALLTLSALVAILVLTVAVKSTQAEERVSINQSQSKNGVDVKLIDAKIISDGLGITYSMRSPSNALRVGAATVILGDGTRVEASRSTQVGEHEWMDVVPWDTTGSKQVATVDLDSVVVFDTTAEGSVTIALGPDFASVVDDNNQENTSLQLDAVLKIGDREYNVTELIVDRESLTRNFILVVYPANEAAKLSELAAGPATVSLSDDKGNSYAWIGTRTRWTRAVNKREVAWQQLSFEGSPDSSAKQFALMVKGVGDVAGPFVFEGIPLP